MWWEIERAVAYEQQATGQIPANETEALIHEKSQPRFSEADVRITQEIEETARHDVAAFLEFVRDWYGEPEGRWIHYGLTSSDLVDTAQGMRFKTLWPYLMSALDGLVAEVGAWSECRDVVLGRTHGQVGEPITIGTRAAHWAALVSQASYGLVGASDRMTKAKLSGPMGTFAHNPPELEARVAGRLGLQAQGRGASQIVPRGALADWASNAARMVQACAKIAMDLRLMNLLGEVQVAQSKGQVGSSAMAHKNNPIRAEKIGGMARLAAGYASMLQPLDLWLERDISNSSVERVAVPDLWHVLLHTLEQTALLLRETELDMNGIKDSIDEAGGLEMVSYLTLAGVREGRTVSDAREWAVRNSSRKIQPIDPSYFTRNYPYSDR